MNTQETPSFDPHGASRDKAWLAVGTIAEELREEVPSVGRNVIVIGGRKHKGKSGEVFYHAKDKFIKDLYRYSNDMQIAVMEARGKHGFRVGIRTIDGERFFVPAEYVEVQK